jgi:hypothetical protein
MLLLALAAATAATVVHLLLNPPGGIKRPPRASAPLADAPASGGSADVQPCAGSQAQGYVGSMTRVLPAASPASPAPAPAPAATLPSVPAASGPG